MNEHKIRGKLIIKLNANINITQQISDQRLHKKIHAKTHKIYESKVKLTRIVFNSPEHVKKYSTVVKNISRTHSMLFWNFYEEIKHAGVQVARKNRCN